MQVMNLEAEGLCHRGLLLRGTFGRISHLCSRNSGDGQIIEVLLPLARVLNRALFLFTQALQHLTNQFGNANCIHFSSKRSEKSLHFAGFLQRFPPTHSALSYAQSLQESHRTAPHREIELSQSLSTCVLGCPYPLPGSHLCLTADC